MISEEKIISIFESIDKERDGKISKEEFRITSRLKLLSLIHE